MGILTCWASINIVGSAAGYAVTNDKKEKYFYGMNAAWGAVNLAIALPGFLSKKPEYSSKTEALKDQIKTEKVFLVNGILDLVYIAGGFGMNQVAVNQIDVNKKAIYSGFGNSIILQGSALLAFDAIMLALNRRNRRKNLQPILENTQISFQRNGLRLIYTF